ncbi:lipid A biosynthesis lauroyl acyltransferase [Cellvibrio japonicus]|uniref:Lipid A biosynthesis acyltransferase n=1 Tax=Cellvibrio japonicus (strain Ueda107) TaxID=498211 RepID=B3PDF7_CELJU|nr:lipid A biosynthesis lauroyl acyltransferase [Cellvibrio japonicus]ACE84399.1 lipid A biosynthesis lauroyl acyltransferase [Cellvibrio japonicus Ueda107]QEI11982.1 lipid A biosynthesis lauroyl acyltransferase [Cellvibrio japonicus]QEI15556.1 lipid A biosynthesis lauroyl acyltransferase [Cellvibrio japonicus]QEI19135.1 lipid A biosynthesis lauroyl acyltransferase [Cellvibrio japonicus]
MSSPQFTRALLAPRHWPSWIGAGIWFLMAQLPFRVQWWLAKLLCPLLYLNKKRIHMARTNLRLCFPDKTEAEREQLLKENLFSTAMAVFETGIAWFWPKWRLRRLFTITGVEHVEQAKQEGQGALLLSLHFTTLDIGSAMLGQYVNYDGMYSPHSNPVYDYLQKVRREAYCKGGTAISRDNLRAIVNQLRKARMIWYAPDRDLGPKASIFVPFFGVPTATVTATAQFARMGRAKIIPFTQYRRADGSGYDVVIHPAFDNYPTGDDYADARRVNEFMETEILKHPEQYFWAQPRFKTRPEGEEKVY